jgi:AcrR family transcriptional regulator
MHVIGERRQDAFDVASGFGNEVVVDHTVHVLACHASLPILCSFVVLEYYDGMEVPRQGAVKRFTDRSNQKRRTRAAVVDAAQQLIDRGVTPTVAQAAEAALVSRTTAYRYFPTQDALLREISATIQVSEVDTLVAQPLDRDGIPGRLQEIFNAFNRHVLDNETRYRTAMRFYLDTWLAARNNDEHTEPVLRGGRRTRWIATSLAPLRDTMSEAALHRLEAALCLVAGLEAMIVMHDVCGLESDDALAVTRWAAQAILEAGLRDFE